jgi:hypothetical protein
MKVLLYTVFKELAAGFVARRRSEVRSLKAEQCSFSAHYHHASGLTIEMIDRLLGMSAPFVLVILTDSKNEGPSVVDL